MHVSLISNGFFIGWTMAARIREAGIHRVALSIDGLEATHNLVRRNPHSFHRVCQAVRLLKQSGVRVDVVTHINCANLSELPAMEELFAQLQIDVWRLQLGTPLGRLARHPELLLQPESLPPIADFIVSAKQRNRIHISVSDNIGYFSHHERLLRKTPEHGGWNSFCGCSAGCLNIGIEANGNVKGCLSLQNERFVEGNIRQEPLAKIWNKKGNFAYTREFHPADLHGFCRNCEYGEICRGGCAFMAFNATGAPHNNPYCLHRVQDHRPARSAT
jgi:radical SAM protein with 4Fe4S-binding SPASM domain